MNLVSTFDPIKYKIKTIDNWNIVAQRYHNEWAGINLGPFGSTKQIVDLAEIDADDKVLDLACGTGIVSKIVSRKLGKKGILIGCDIAFNPLKIAI